MPDTTHPAVHYTVRFPSESPHYAEIEGRIPLDVRHSGSVELALPVWTPGSYLVREYSRHIESFTACSPQGERLVVVKTRKNRWRIATSEALTEVIIRYRLYCNELTVRTNFVDEAQALLHGAATFLEVLDEGDQPGHRPYEVSVEVPPQWEGCWSALPGERGRFHAADYDRLVDSPILAGNPSTCTFTLDDKQHILITFGDTSYWDFGKAMGDIEKIVKQHRAMWGELPYERYLFFNLLAGGRGALEHRDSMVLLGDRFTMRNESTYIRWLNLVSHEFFHVWNVKRLRPIELGPFNYESEVYTRNLWIAEGFTEYYGALAVCRAGLATRDEFLGTDRVVQRGMDSLSGWIDDLQNTPGRAVQPVSLSSFDAWIKFYRPDENARNSSVSYYTKGAVLAWLLDAKVRHTTSGGKSLDDVMRIALQRYGGSQGYSSADFLEVVQEVAGINLSEWISGAVDGTDELDYVEALDWFGLRFRPIPAPKPETASRKPWTGFATKVESGRLIVTEVLRNSPGYEAGLCPGDEVLGLGEYRVRPEQWNSTVDIFRPQEVLDLLVCRRERLTRIQLQLGDEPARSWNVEVQPDATEEQRQNLARWLTNQAQE